MSDQREEVDAIPDFRIPPLVFAFSAAGLIPFAVPALLLATGGWPDPAFLRDALTGYAIAILSFMGGIHWGWAMRDGRNTDTSLAYTIGILPPLAGWLTLFLSGDIRFYALAACFALLLWADLVLVRRDLAPTWYPKLRKPLTVIVCASLILAAMVT